MRVALLSPYIFPRIRGNSVTVRRIRGGLAEKGLKVKEFSMEDCPEDDIEKFRPGIIHAFHAFKSGVCGLKLSEKLGVPLVVTITGSDINRDIFQRNKRKRILEVLDHASAVTVFQRDPVSELSRYVESKKITVIPPSVHLPACPVRKNKHDEFIVLFSGGIRPIKRPLHCIKFLVKLKQSFPELIMRYAGPLEDKDLKKQFLEISERYPWVEYLGVIPHERIQQAYAECDVLLNCSESEGLSNSVLEAMRCGKPVIASNVPGNREIIEDGITGFLFSSGDEFIEKMGLLIRDSELRGKMGKKAAEFTEKNFSFSREIQGYLDLYSAL